MSYIADQLKERGNAHFRKGEYDSAELCYGQAIQKNSSNPLLYTNRANARMKLQQWDGVIDDCLRSIDLLSENMKAYFYLAQAQLAISHPNEALSSAIRAYEICVSSLTTSKPQSASASTISQLVLRCKKDKWDLREKKRLHRRSELLAELETGLEKTRDGELGEITSQVKTEQMGQVAAAEERSRIQEEFNRKLQELRSVFAIADPENLGSREIPDYLVDSISFELMHDPVITKNGNSYERATIIEHLKHSETDPLTREHLSIKDLRPNIALREACTEFLENNKGWVYEW